jgi:UDP-2-acetamido-3-amino-2,3-dideoxy-glucuronate N-acetyltransferase
VKKVAPWAHPTAVIDPGAHLGEGTKVWHFCHVMSGARVGRRCVLGQNVFVAASARIGDGCRLQNNVSIYDGVVLEDEVFVGPSAVFTNVRHPRAMVDRRATFERTLVGRGATIGANATVVCGVTIGAFAFVGAGAVVTRDVAEHAMVAGVPARRTGWICRCGETRGPLKQVRACGCLRQLERSRRRRASTSHPKNSEMESDTREMSRSDSSG